MNSKNGSIKGSIVALITPMQADGQLDVPALRRLIDWHIQEGTDCICVVGTTGESPTVSMQEHCEIIRLAVEHANGRVPIMAGAGANSTREAIELTGYAKDVGADAVLSVVPYYNKPTQEGIYQHFKTIVDAVDIPLVLYNVPGRTVADMQPETTLRLAQLSRIVGIKEASGNFERTCFLINNAPAHFAIYSGDDATAVTLMLMGGHGNISVTANVAPRAMHDLCMAAMKGEVATARKLHMKLWSLHKYLFIEPSPAPTKWALSQLGLCENHLRLPLINLSPEGQALVFKSMQEAGIHASLQDAPISETPL
jgi:4-hydroxy-tetrahydrodipicolinate synthase